MLTVSEGVAYQHCSRDHIKESFFCGLLNSLISSEGSYINFYYVTMDVCLGTLCMYS